MAVYLGNNKLTFDGISEIYVGSNKVYSAAPVDYSTEYFYVENLTNSDNTLTISKSYSSAPTITVYYSTDKTNWTSVSTMSSTTVNIPSGSKVFLKSSDGKWASNTAYWNYVACSNDFAVGGNIMSLISGDNFIGSTLTNSNALANLFNGRTSLKNIDNLVLGSTSLTSYCYYRMFNGCTSLTSVPSNLLPATSLATNCYQEMFKGCTGITNVPDLPSTALTTYCYADMFNGCTSLTSVPSTLLHSTTLSDYCYYYMFNGCTGLTNVPSLPATSTTTYCYAGMFTNCTGITTIPTNFLPATTLGTYCYNEMFNGCTGITTIPSNLLPATTLASTCYRMMFNGCIGITSIPSNLLPATTLVSNCYQFMFRNCTGITNVPPDLLPATTLGTYCYGGMFLGCSSITTAPTLPATTLAQYCYYQMFQDCSSLNEITCYANDISARNCTSSWVNGVSATGTFHQRGDAAWTTGNNGIPTGWTVIDERPYNPINDYFWVENITDSSITVSIGGGEAYIERANLYGQLSDSYPKVQYSTDKTTWSGGSGGTRSFTVPAKTRLYLRSVSGMTTGSSTYYYFGNPSSGPIWMSVYGWGAILYNSYSFYYLTLFSSVLSPSVNHSITVGGNIRTILGYADSGVGNTTGLSYTRSYYNKGNSYCSERYWNGLGKETATGSTSNAQSGLYFSGIKDASQLYIGTTDVRPDFVNTPSDFVGPIYT